MEQHQVQEHFARQADEYEELMVRLVPQYLFQHRVIQDLLPDEDREYRVLDLGCGNGILSELVFTKLPRARVVGFDLTESMLQAYRKKLARFADRFSLQAGDFRVDPIGNGYDIILAGLTLHHLTWQERRTFYQDIYSALNRGGKFIARDIIIDEDQDVTEDHCRRWKNFITAQGEDAEFWYAKHREKDHPMTLTVHFSWLQEAGFIKTACHWRLYNFAVTSAERP